MGYIKNRDELLSHGNVKLRKDTLDIIDHALLKADPYVQVKNLVKLEGDMLTVGELEYNLKEYGCIYILGAGKATYPIVKALEEILEDKIADGVITCKYGQEGTLSYCRLYFASHPVPDEAGLRASHEIMKIARQAQAKDIIFCGITGGSTSLMPLPVKGISLDDLKMTYRLLLRSSANIIEMNAVRKHLCTIKGGWLAKNIHPKAEIINLTVSDVIGDALDYITCPTVPDTSTFDDARKTLTKYNLWEKVPQSVSNYLKNAGPEQETPKDLSDHQIHNFIIVKGDAACVGASDKAREMGYDTIILSTMLEGESKEVGATLAAIGKEILLNGRPLKMPCVVIGGGETTMKIIGEAGEGGPNQQFALAAATWIEGLDKIVIAGVDTDGTDGVSNLAGGIVDGQTLEIARKQGIDVFKHINQFDDTPALRALGDGVYTGATGTNVNDLKLLLVCD
ncbi:MAG: glycerate kinase [Clostridia bacterium]